MRRARCRTASENSDVAASNASTRWVELMVPPLSSAPQLSRHVGPDPEQITRSTVRPVILRLGDERLPFVGRARLYVCGITPYDTTHLGHAAAFVWMDALARVLTDAGLGVFTVRNVTDV